MNTSMSWRRWLITLISGIAIWYVSGMLSILAALALAGDEAAIFGHFWPTFMFSVVRALVVILGMKYVWRIVNRDLASIGFTWQNFKQEALVGAAFGLSLALFQYFVLLPLTGGSQRPDIIASAELIGTNRSSLFAAIIMGWLAGGVSEEIFYRGHLIRSLYKLLGEKRWAMIASVLVSIVLFSIGHGYQGWIGMLSTGLAALMYTALFLWRKSLTAGIVAHGVFDTLAVIGIYLLFT